MKSKLLIFLLVLSSIQTLQAQKKKIQKEKVVNEIQRKKIIDENGDTLFLSPIGDTIIKHCYILTKDMLRDYRSGRGILIYEQGKVTNKIEDILRDSLYKMILNRDMHVVLLHECYDSYQYLAYLVEDLERKVDSLQHKLEIANMIRESQEKKIIEKDNIITELNNKIHRRRKKKK